MSRAHIIVRGRVQGVFFRVSVKKEADTLGLTGTVKNEEDNTVLIVVEGSKENIEKFIAWCKNGGPTLAKVEGIDVEWEMGANIFSSFLVIL